MATMLLPVVAGFIYPCAIPPVEDGTYIEIDEDDHMGYVDLFNIDRQLMQAVGDDLVDYTPELWATVQAALALHPAMVAWQSHTDVVQAAENAATAPFKERLRLAKERKDNPDQGGGGD